MSTDIQPSSGGPSSAIEPSEFVCHGCGWRAGVAVPAVPRCPAAEPGDGIDHVLVRVLDPSLGLPRGGEANAFARYRTLFHAYHAARALGCSDAEYLASVERLDRAVERVDGRRFRTTPFLRAAALGERLGFGPSGGVYVKDETRNVSGSHKARHLFGTLLELEVADAVRAGECSNEAPSTGGLPAAASLDGAAPRLAIASCGNAALAAAVVARAAGRPLDVFIPPDADPAVVAQLRDLHANLTVCERRPGEYGDPTYLRLLEAIDAGAAPFTCQGNLNGFAIEAGETLGWEMIDALLGSDVELDRVFVQVGGAALASSVIAAFSDARRLGAPVAMPRFHAVQTRGAFPLARAYRLVADRLLGRPATDPADVLAITATPPESDLDEIEARMGTDDGRQAIEYAARHRRDFMWPWETEPHSIAHGILDDETYDWLAVVEGMLKTGGYPVVVGEATLEEANDVAREATGIDVDHTGSSGLAGLLVLLEAGAVRPDERVAVLFTGVRRTQ